MEHTDIRRTLELGKVLERLAALASSENAKERCVSLVPAVLAEEAVRRLRETSAAKAYVMAGGSPSFSGLINVGFGLRRAEMGGSMNTRELLNVARLLELSRKLRTYGSPEGKAAPMAGKNAIGYLFSGLRPNKYFEDKISGAILGEEEISDNASPELSSIRRHMRAAQSKIRDTLQKIISSPSYQKFLQDTIITQRFGRFVVPVKSECRGDVPGLVHDISSSGATLFIEPMQVVNANNDLRELEAKEEKEIERILAELSSEAASFSEEIMMNYDLLVELDCVFAAARLSCEMNGTEPHVGDDGVIDLRRARHPLLDPASAVPIGIRLGEDFDTLVITGPNTGGKTVALKTIGLLTLMAACGLHIPAGDGSRVSVFGHVFADIGDEQSIEQSLSTFSSHMKRIVSILEEVDGRSLVLFDELGAGTDPVEGAALAMAVIGFARSMGAKIVATTHYAELKMFALTTSGVENAACEFDVDTLRPTYRLLIGVPGKSNAFAISARLGLSEHVIANARAMVASENREFEDVLEKLEAQRHALEEARAGAEASRREAQERLRKAEEYLASAESVRENASERARAEARRVLADARAEAESVFAELGEMRRRAAKEADFQSENAARAELKRRLNEAENAVSSGDEATEEGPEERPIEAGATVRLIRMGATATVISPPDKDGNMRLQAGILQITANRSEVRLTGDGRVQTPEQFIKQAEEAERSIPAATEIDIRGMTVEEAVGAAEIFIDRAMLSKLAGVTIIHGKGTGALRSAVHAALRKNRAVKNFRLGRYGEGESGVTIVEMAN